jgi:hypothetical protein
MADVVGYPCKGWKATKYCELEYAVTSALDNLTGPSIIQVVVPPKSTLDNAKWKETIDAKLRAASQPTKGRGLGIPTPGSEEAG